MKIGGSDMSGKHDCNMCGGVRDHNGKLCLGCGTDIARCKKPGKKGRNSESCPGCAHSGPHSVLEYGRRVCQKCKSVFEAADFSFVDTRPDVNAEKKEESQFKRRKHGGRHPR